MKIQPIITTGTTDKGNTYVKSNAGKYFAAAELGAVAVTTGLVVAAEQKAFKGKIPVAKYLKPAFKSAKESVKAFFTHPMQSLKEFGKKINMKSIKEAGSKFVKDAKALPPAVKAVLFSAALILTANLGVDFAFNKMSAHKADKHA